MSDTDDVQRTRRETADRPAAEQMGEESRLETASVGATRRETRPREPGGDVQPDPVGETRREGSPAQTGQTTNSLLALPTALRADYAIVRELPNPGTEADVLEVADTAGHHHVVKIYRAGVHAEASVWSVLADLDSAHIVKISATGESDGRDYEVMEYVSGGNLTLLLQGSRQLAPELVTTIVAQIADALVALHEKSIVHRDLKPENVLIRRYDSAGIDLVVTDFGLARLLAQSVVQASRSGTLAYLPPEALLPSGAEVSNKWDWWSLGVIARELATGVRAHAQLSAATVEKATLIHGVDVSEIGDPRLRLLCRGLLTRVPQDRWGSVEVARWCGGESPDVAEPVPETHEKVAPFRFNGVDHRTRESFARGLQNDWATAARRFFVAMGAAQNPSEAWRRLRAWLQQFGEEPGLDRDAFEELLDQTLTSTSSTPDRKLFALIRWLDPALPVIYRGVDITRDNLATLALSAAGRQAEDQNLSTELLYGLFEPGLLADVARTTGYGWLAEVGSARDALWREERRYRDHWAAHIPPDALPPAADPRIPAELLHAVLLPGPALDRMAQLLRTQLSTLPEQVNVPWFAQLTYHLNHFLDYFIAVQAFPTALRHGQEIQRQRDAAAAAQQGRELHWARREHERLADSAAAQRLTLRFLIPSIGAIALLLLVPASYALSAATALAAAGWLALNAAAGVGAAAYLAISEIRLAGELGADYRGRTRFSQSGRGLRAFGSGMTAGRGCLLMFLGLWVVGIVLWLPVLVYGLVALLQLRSVRRRRQEWLGWQHHAYRQIMGGGR